MANINDWFSKTNSVLEQSPLFFLVPETERGLGLEEKLQNYHIITPELDYFAKQNKSQNISYVNLGKGSSVDILFTDTFRELMAQKLPPGCQSFNIQFFKHTSDGELNRFNGLQTNSGKGLTAKLVNNSARLSRQIENKVKQYHLIKENGLEKYLPKGMITNLAELNLENIKHTWSEFVVQFPFGHTGESTLIFSNEMWEQSAHALNTLKQQKPQLMCKVVQFVPGHPFTVNACVYNKKTYVAGLSYQYTGIGGLTALQSATVGNDWGIVEKLLNEQQRLSIVTMAAMVGDLLAVNYDYRGLFGIDLIWDQSDNTPKLIEINARQTLSVPMHTKLQIQKEQIPLAMLHLASFLDINIALDVNEYNMQAASAVQAAQVFLRSTIVDDYQLPENYLMSGIYRLVSDNAARERLASGHKNEVIYIDNSDDRPVVWQKDFFSVTDFGAEGMALIIKPPGKFISLNTEIARLQAHQSLAQIISDKVQLLPLAKDTLMSIKNILEP